ncbi:MAG TPA: hypothetical protein VFV87_14035 [Pirellulaceae bacterium]|nr:hypothetical protein [Pirellulaceae bacterium]
MNWRRIQFVISIAILGCILLLLCPSFGSIHYFSPDTLQSRYQVEKLFPGTRIPIYRSGYRESESQLVDYLIRKGHWKPIATKSPRWVLTSHSNSQWKDGQSYVHKEFFWRDEKWVDWSEKNPKRAAVLWPQVLSILRDVGRNPNEACELMFDAEYETRTPAESEFRQ